MRRILPIGAGLILSFALGYWTNEFVDFAEAMGKDQVGLYALKTDSTGRVIINDKSKENFDNFIYKFIGDSLFQLDRIKFPLKSSIQTDLDEADTTAIEKKDWKIVRLFGREEYRPQIYDNFNRELRDTDERLFCWEGIENGIYVEYKFQRLGGLWYLTEYNDFSD
ncbi:MAG: DUF4348 domain-containing protein [Cytophagales bacterium]|nr:DUF4348 domain-containing protein [Cytophagales bacterium]